MMDSYFFIPQFLSRFFSTFPKTPAAHRLKIAALHIKLGTADNTSKSSKVIVEKL
jgi:hypothetical protein